MRGEREEWGRKVWRRRPAVPPLPPPPLPLPHTTTSLSSSSISSSIAPLLALPLPPLLRRRGTHTSSSIPCSSRPTSTDPQLALCRLGMGSQPSNPPPVGVAGIFSLQVVPRRRHPLWEPARTRPMSTTVKARFELKMQL